jgi:hypothetical protein
LRGENGKTSVLTNGVKQSVKTFFIYRRGRKKFDSLLPLMQLLPKQLRKEEFEYYSEQSVEELREHIRYVLSEPPTLDYSVNLVGKFISENQFKMTPKWQFIPIRNYERDEAYLDGRMIPQDKNRTQVKFSIRPNTVFVILFFVFPFGSLMFLSTYFLDTTNNIGFLGGVFAFAVVVPGINLLLAGSAKKRIKENFISTFHLQPIQESPIH